MVGPEECKRLLRPGGGLIFLPQSLESRLWVDQSTGWFPREGSLRYRKAPTEGATDWTHQYGTAGNASYTGEDLGSAASSSGIALQWIGRPGGDFGIDRQPRMPAPLSVNGRLFHQGLDRMVALSAANGAVLWHYEIPALRRLNVAHDCSNWAADEDRLFLAIRDRLWILRARDGTLERTVQLPSRDRATHEWGYVAHEETLVIGSAVRAGSHFRNYWGDGAWFDKVGTANAVTQVCSDRLFAHRKTDGAELWSYRNGLVINSTLALQDGKLCFLENRTLELPEHATGQIADRRLWLDLTAVCLDARTGDVLWEKPGPKPKILTEKIGFIQSAYGMMTAEGYLTVLSEGAVDEKGQYLKKGEFLCQMLDAKGDEKWKATSPWGADHHGLHITHPVATEDTLYLAPHVHDLATGKPTGQKYGPRRGCSTIVGTKHALLFRVIDESGAPLGFWDRKTGSASQIDFLRPSCWLNYLPSQGMLLVPEGGAGCSCGGWIETSVGFRPRTPGK